MRRTLVAAVLAAAVLIVGTVRAQEVDAPSGLVDSKKLTYGCACSFPPFEYLVDGKIVGFDTEMGAALAKKMGLAVEVLNMDFRGLIPALQGKRIDIINSAMYINPERAQQVDFIPYMRIGNQILVRKGNPKGIKGVDDLSGKTVAVTLGAIEETYARKFNDTFKAQGKPLATILTLPTAQDSAVAVRQGRADAFLMATPGAAYTIATAPDAFETAGPTFEANTQIGIAVRKGDAEMKRAVEQALRAIVKDGTFDTLREKYNLPKDVSLF